MDEQCARVSMSELRQMQDEDGIVLCSGKLMLGGFRFAGAQGFLLAIRIYLYCAYGCVRV